MEMLRRKKKEKEKEASRRKKEDSLRRKEKEATRKEEDIDRARRKSAVYELRPTHHIDPRYASYEHDIRRTRSYGDPTAHMSPADYEAQESLHRYREAAETEPRRANPEVYMTGARHTDDGISGAHGSDDDDHLVVRRSH